MPRPIWRLVLGWMVVLPLLFFTTDGNLSTSQDDAKVRIILAGDNTVSHRLPTAVALMICGGLVLARFQSVAALCVRMKTLLAMPLLALVSCMWSRDVRQTIVSASILLIFTVFALYLTNAFSPHRQFELIMFVGGIVVPLSIAVAVILPQIGTTAAGWRGVLGHKNTLSMLVTLMLVTALHWPPRGLCQRVFRVIYIAMCALLIVMAQSRGGWLLAAIALFLTGALRLLQRAAVRDSIAVIVAAVPVFAFAGYAIHNFGPMILEAVGKDPTLNERTVIWAAAWDAITKHFLLGYGYNAFWSNIQGPSQSMVLAAGWAINQAQDGYLDLWLQVGVLGIALVAMMALQAAKDIARYFYRTPHGGYVRWCIVVLVCTFVYNVGESSIAVPRLSWLLFLLACAGLSQIAHGGNCYPSAPQEQIYMELGAATPVTA